MCDLPNFVYTVVKRCFKTRGKVTVGANKIECITFTSYMVLSQNETSVNELLKQLERSCKQHEININIKKKKGIGNKQGTTDDIKVGEGRTVVLFQVSRK